MSAQPTDHQYNEILARSAVDADFRRKLIADPHTAIRDAFGIEIPADRRVSFVERAPGAELVVVLPDAILTEEALSELELEAVAGGTDTQNDTSQCGYMSGNCMTQPLLTM